MVEAVLQWGAALPLAGCSRLEECNQLGKALPAWAALAPWLLQARQQRVRQVQWVVWAWSWGLWSGPFYAASIIPRLSTLYRVLEAGMLRFVSIVRVAVVVRSFRVGSSARSFLPPF